jgi:hypothetical protein
MFVSDLERCHKRAGGAVIRNGGIAPFRVTDGGGKRRSFTAFCHINIPITRYFEAWRGDAMHFDYIVLSLLIVGMLSAAAMALSQRKSH